MSDPDARLRNYEDWLAMFKIALDERAKDIDRKNEEEEAYTEVYECPECGVELSECHYLLFGHSECGSCYHRNDDEIADLRAGDN